METITVSDKKTVAAHTLRFLESKYRLTGLVREIYIARGWIKKTDATETHYQITPKGAKVLHEL